MVTWRAAELSTLLLMHSRTPGTPSFALLPWGFVISSIKIYSRYSFMSDVIGPLGTLWNLLKGNFIILKILWSDARQKKKCRAFQK